MCLSLKPQTLCNIFSWFQDPRRRLGGGPADAEEVKAHKFFRAIAWDDLLKKNIPAPFIPKIASDTDVSNFSEEFTSMRAADSPGITPPNVEKVCMYLLYIWWIFGDKFRGFSNTLSFKNVTFFGTKLSVTELSLFCQIVSYKIFGFLIIFYQNQGILDHC